MYCTYLDVLHEPVDIALKAARYPVRVTQEGAADWRHGEALHVPLVHVQCGEVQLRQLANLGPVLTWAYHISMYEPPPMGFI